VLIFDARLALQDGDRQRACENYIAALGLARQARQDPYLISDLIGIAIHKMVAVEISRQLRDQPGLFDQEQLTRLAHTHARLTKQPGIELDYERMFMRDTLQRTYSDNGRGDGRMTPEAFRYFGLMSAPPDDFGPVSSTQAALIDPRVRAAAMPLSMVFSNSRAEERELYNSVLDEAQLVLDRGVEWIATMREAALIEEKYRASETPMRYSFSALLTPAMRQVVHNWYNYEQVMGAFSLMIAMEAYRAEHAHLPDSLSLLQPRYVPQLPMDLMDPGRTLKYLVDGDRYVIYSVGSDGDDDGARKPAGPTDPYLRDQEQMFDLRFPQARSPMTYEPIYEPSGKPRLAEPTGPDGDWVLIDTRLLPDDAGES
jgi:hypothetical protein